MAAPEILDDERRIDALTRLGLLDTPAEDRFDRITRLAAALLDVPIALVTLVDADRQWLKSAVGVPAISSPREHAFCAQAIAADDDDLFIVPDATSDPRFAQNPAVVGGPGIRFYAARILRNHNGYALGTFCILDRVPRTLDDGQRQCLRDLGALAESEIERTSQQELMLQLDESERQRSLIFATLAAGLVLQDAGGRITNWNATAEQLLGLSENSMVGRSWSDSPWRVVRADGTPWDVDSRPSVRALRTGEAVRDAILGVDRSDGSRVWLRTNAQPIVEDGAVHGVLSAFTDVTAEFEANRRALAVGDELRMALARSEATARASVDALEQGVVLADETGQVRRMNPAAQRLLQYGADELSAQWQQGSFPMFDEDGNPIAPSDGPIIRALTTGQRVDGAIVGWDRRDGTRLVLRVSCTPNADGQGGFVIAFADVTQERRMLRELAHLAEELAYRADYDELTGIPNRRVLHERLAEALHRSVAQHRATALCFVDLDRFKHINDTYGHAAGDRVLVAVAHAIRACMRAGDTAARVGGDEFVIILEPVDGADHALAIAKGIRAAVLAETDAVAASLGMDRTVGACFGIAISAPDDTPSTLLNRADSALYGAKKRRKSTIELAAVVGNT